MKGKRGSSYTILIVILFFAIAVTFLALFSLSVRAATPIECTSPNIACNEACVEPRDLTVFDYTNLPNCTIVQSLSINVGNANLKKYYFNNLVISPDVTVHFYAGSVSPQSAINGNKSVGKVYAIAGSFGGNAGEAIDGDSGGGCENGEGCGGGQGGAGGGLLKAGGNGYKGEEGSKCDDRGTPSGGPGGKPGGNVAMFASTVNVGARAVVSVDGLNGSDGGPGDDSCGCDACNNYGEGSGGGGGGGGAGIFNIYARTISFDSTANLTAKGGIGGNTGKPGKDVGGGNDDDDDGCFGGAGGGGAGGIINITYTEDASLQTLPTTLIISGGAGGYVPDKHQCNDPPEKGKGDAGTQQYNSGAMVQITESDNLSQCLDNIDNDLDGFKDLEDANCWNDYLLVESALNFSMTGDISLYDFTGVVGKRLGGIAGKDFNPFALDGADGVCGDDNFDGSCSQKAGASGEACGDGVCGEDRTCVGSSCSCIEGSYSFSYSPQNSECANDYGDPYYSYTSAQYCNNGQWQPIGYCDFWNPLSGCDAMSFTGNSSYCSTVHSLLSNYDYVRNESYCSGYGGSSTCYFLDIFSGNPSPAIPEYISCGCGSGYSCQSGQCIANCAGSGESFCQSHTDDCTWSEISDLGWATGNERYLCADSWFTYNDGTGEFSEPGQYYEWFDAENMVNRLDIDPYLILQIGNNHFVSNEERWFQCNAAGQSINNGLPLINEFGTFNGKNPNGELDCYEMLEDVLELERDNSEINVSDCPNSQTQCRQQCINEGPNCGGWCSSGSTYSIGNFVDECGSECYVRNGESTSFDKLTDYARDDEDFEGYVCEVSGVEDNCDVPEGDTGGSDYLSQVYCKKYPELCVGNIVAADQTCRSIHIGMGYVYTTDDKKLCDATDYCTGGYLLQTDEYNSNNKGPLCCLGQNAYCAPFEMEVCEDIGGEVKPQNNCDSCVCTGIEKEECCIGGSWVDYDSLSFGSNESFICNAQDSKSFIKECCGVAGCYNSEKKNTNNGGDSLRSLNSLYSLDGVPLHSLMNFDYTFKDVDNDAEIPTSRVRVFFKKSTGEYLDIDNIGAPERAKYNFTLSNFSYLEFDVLYNDAGVDYVLRLIGELNGQEQICSKHVADYITVRKGPLKWQHVTVDLTDCNIGYLRDMELYLGEIDGDRFNSINLSLDNFFLQPKDVVAESDNRFCSGNWGDWVENLDGPSASNQRGFFGNNSMKLAGYGPYRDACEGVISYGWTGHVCCGDDTKRGLRGEYWVDNNGVCWNGTTVMEGQTIAGALGMTPLISVAEWNASLRERSLLYYNKELLVCDLNSNNFSTYMISFDGINANSSTSYMSGMMKFVPAYSVRGNWMCQPDEGWISLKDVNRVRFLAATLKGAAENLSPRNYTLVCGEFADEVNQFGSMTEDQKLLTDYACVLRMGDNRFKGGEKVIVGLELAANVTYDMYKEGVLNSSPVLGLETDTCASLPDNMNANESFFSRCASGGDFYIYYSKPFGLVLLSDGRANQGPKVDLPFFKSLWEKFKAFFARLFKTGNNAPGDEFKVYSFDQNKFSKDFYISVQGTRVVRGVYESIGPDSSIDVEYVNFSSSVEILSRAVKWNYALANVSYNKSVGYAGGDLHTQKIFVSYGMTENVDWKLITSILRVIPQGTAYAYETEIYNESPAYNPTHIFDTVHNELPPEGGAPLEWDGDLPDEPSSPSGSGDDVDVPEINPEEGFPEGVEGVENEGYDGETGSDNGTDAGGETPDLPPPPIW